VPIGAKTLENRTPKRARFAYRLWYRSSQRSAARFSAICSLGMPRLEEISAGENPSEIKAAIRRVAFPVGDKLVQFTELAVGIEVEREDDGPVRVAAVSEAQADPVDDLEVVEAAVEESREASPVRCFVPGIEAEVEPPGSGEEEGHGVLVVILFERSAEAAQASI